MRLAFVIDDARSRRNGTTMTALRYARALRARGHEVRLVAYGAEGEGAFPVERCHYPVVDFFGSRQGFTFGKPSEEVFGRAFDGVDVVHLFLPFKLERHALRAARERRIPVSAAFHLQPENITYNANLSWVPGGAAAVYAYFRNGLYNRVRHVHCPSQLIADSLSGTYGYQARMHVISNGVAPDFTPGLPASPFKDGLFHIVTVGRLAHEKNQVTLVRAVARSKHADKIQLHLAGAGPLERYLRAEGERLPHKPDIGFRRGPELVELLRSCDLYVHCSVVDSEAISCIEAFSTGLVPVISNSPLSATHQFALAEENLYPARDVEALARRIDYWIEHPDERASASHSYVRESSRYRLDACIDAFLAMEEQAIADDAAVYGVASAVEGTAR